MALELKNYDPAIMQGANVGVSVDLTDITDASGNEVIEIDGATSAVNYLRIGNAATSANPNISAQGDDSNVGLTLTPKGTSGLTLAVSGVTTGNAVDINSSGLTTGVGLDASDADALTTGACAKFVSNSSSGSTRSIVLVKQDHASATAATALEVWQDGGSSTVGAIAITGAPSLGIYAVSLGTQPLVNLNAGSSDTPTTNPGTNAVTGWIKIIVGGTSRYIPFYV